MAKAIALYYGHNSAAQSIEVATREDGKMFSRVYEFNGWQNAWSKWIPAPLVFRIDENFVTCKTCATSRGGAILHLVPGPYNLRLPN